MTTVNASMIDTIKKTQAAMAGAAQSLGRQINIMEVCGTHTVSIFRHGIRSLLGDSIRMISGPGCPVCVTDQGYIDLLLKLARRPECIIATYGDMMRVPGSNRKSLETTSAGRNVKVVYSAENAVQIARENPEKTVVFAAVGFETTTPATAVAVTDAASENLTNFCVLCAHKLVVPAMAALLGQKEHRIDAFLCPGHVSVIIGYEAFGPIVRQFNRPCVVAGFEPLQVLEGIERICDQLIAGKSALDSVYKAVVSAGGNKTAQALIDECFVAADGYWRGLGKIEKSTLGLREKYAQYDAFKKFRITESHQQDLSGCRCGEVLCGLIDPPGCKLFGTKCTVAHPVGPCMVSSEGACSAWYKYGQH